MWTKLLTSTHTFKPTMLTHFCTSAWWEWLGNRTVHELCDWNKSSLQQPITQTSTSLPWPTCRSSAVPLSCKGAVGFGTDKTPRKSPTTLTMSLKPLLMSPYHFIVLLRLGWLTVLSSINIVEQELYFFVSCPGETLGKKKRKKEEKNWKIFKKKDSVSFCLAPWILALHLWLLHRRSLWMVAAAM